jgi:putative MATE family efflux protein
LTDTSEEQAGQTPAPRTYRIRTVIWDSIRGVSHDYTKGSLRMAIVLLAIPMVLEMAMESVFAVCDIFFVSRIGTDAMATVGLTESLLTLLYAVAIGLAMATTAMVARRIGEKRPDAARVAAVQSLWLGLAVAIVIGVPCFIYAPRLLELMGASAGIVETGVSYTRIMLGFNVVIVFLFLNNAIFRGAGNAAIAMRALWLANGINIVLDPCLIFGLGPFPEMGVQGAAVATTIGRGLGVVYQFYCLRAGSGSISLAGSWPKVDLAILRRLVRVSVGGIGQFLIATASWVILMRLVAPFGSAALAGYTISIRILIFAILPSWGLANAAATMVGQSLGAGKPERAEQAVWISGRYNMYFLGAVTVLFVSFAPWLVQLFTQDPEIVPVAISSLRILSYGYVFYAWGMVLGQAFNGAGDTATPTWINFIAFWIIEIPLAWWLSTSTSIGLDGVFWSVLTSDMIFSVIAALVFRRGGWKNVQV